MAGSIFQVIRCSRGWAHGPTHATHAHTQRPPPTHTHRQRTHCISHPSPSFHTPFLFAFPPIIPYPPSLHAGCPSIVVLCELAWAPQPIQSRSEAQNPLPTRSKPVFPLFLPPLRHFVFLCLTRGGEEARRHGKRQPQCRCSSSHSGR